MTHHTKEALFMPFRPKRSDTCLYYRLLASPALSTESPSMTSHTPRITIFFYERRLGVERIAAFSAEEMPYVPGATTSYHDLTLNRGFAAAAAWRVKLVKIKMAIET